MFKNLAHRVKTSVDWFFGFKLHLGVNERGELLNVILTPGNVDDRKPIPELLRSLFGTVFADRGYVSQKLANQLLEDLGIHFFAKPRRHMKNQLMRLHDKLLARQRSIIEIITKSEMIRILQKLYLGYFKFLKLKISSLSHYFTVIFNPHFPSFDNSGEIPLDPP